MSTTTSPSDAAEQVAFVGPEKFAAALGKHVPVGQDGQIVSVSGVQDIPPAGGIVRKAVQAAWVIGGPRVVDAIFSLRMNECLECENRVVRGAKSYCGRCGCGHWSKAELSEKLRYARLKCPKGRFDAIEEVPGSILLEDSGPVDRAIHAATRVLRGGI